MRRATGGAAPPLSVLETAALLPSQPARPPARQGRLPPLLPQDRWRRGSPPGRCPSCRGYPRSGYDGARAGAGGIVRPEGRGLRGARGWVARFWAPDASQSFGGFLPAQARWLGVGRAGSSPAWRPRWEGASGSLSLLAPLPSPWLWGNSGRVALEPAKPLKSPCRLPQAAGG